jgi:hypothetical protein
MVLLLTIATAQEPVVTVTDNGVKATIVVHAEKAEVQALLEDPDTLYSLSPDIVSVNVVETKGSCQQVETAAKGLFSNIEFTELRCKNSQGGVSQRLVGENDTFSRYNVDWTVREVEEGTELTYELDASLAAPLPDRVMHEAAGNAASGQLANIYAHYEALRGK